MDSPEKGKWSPELDPPLEKIPIEDPKEEGKKPTIEDIEGALKIIKEEEEGTEDNKKTPTIH